MNVRLQIGKCTPRDFVYTYSQCCCTAVHSRKRGLEKKVEGIWQVGLNRSAGRMWPASRSLVTPTLGVHVPQIVNRWAGGILSEITSFTRSSEQIFLYCSFISCVMSYGSTLVSFRQEFGTIKIQILSSFFRLKEKPNTSQEIQNINIWLQKSQVGNPAATITWTEPLNICCHIIDAQ